MAIYCGNAVAFALIMGGLLSGRAQRIPDSPIANNQSAHQSAQDSTPKHDSNGIASWAIKYPDTFLRTAGVSGNEIARRLNLASSYAPAATPFCVGKGEAPWARTP
jgi:hypothetical protein